MIYLNWFRKCCVSLYLSLSVHRCKGSADCEACQSTVSMERVCSLSSPDSTLSTSSSASAQSSTSPCKHPNRYGQFNRFKQSSYKCFSSFYISCLLPSSLVSPPCSMSDDEQESGCDTVDSSPASDASGHSNSPFAQQRFIGDSNQNCEPRVACVAPETEPSKPTVRTVVVPPMRVQNNNNPAVNETCGSTGKNWTHDAMLTQIHLICFLFKHTDCNFCN